MRNSFKNPETQFKHLRKSQSMYPHSNSTISVRNRTSFWLSDIWFLNGGEICSVACCSSVNPRKLYGSRQSTLVHWSVSRRMLMGKYGLCRSELCDCDLERVRRERLIPYQIYRNEVSDSSTSKDVEEMIDLLSEKGEMCLEEIFYDTIDVDRNECLKNNSIFEQEIHQTIGSFKMGRKLTKNHAESSSSRRNCKRNDMIKEIDSKKEASIRERKICSSFRHSRDEESVDSGGLSGRFLSTKDKFYENKDEQFNSRTNVHQTQKAYTEESCSSDHKNELDVKLISCQDKRFGYTNKVDITENDSEAERNLFGIVERESQRVSSSQFAEEKGNKNHKFNSNLNLEDKGKLIISQKNHCIEQTQHDVSISRIHETNNERIFDSQQKVDIISSSNMIQHIQNEHIEITDQLMEDTLSIKKKKHNLNMSKDLRDEVVSNSEESSKTNIEKIENRSSELDLVKETKISQSHVDKQSYIKIDPIKEQKNITDNSEMLSKMILSDQQSNFIAEDKLVQATRNNVNRDVQILDVNDQREESQLLIEKSQFQKSDDANSRSQQLLEIRMTNQREASFSMVHTLHDSILQEIIEQGKHATQSKEYLQESTNNKSRYHQSTYSKVEASNLSIETSSSDSYKSLKEEASTFQELDDRHEREKLNSLIQLEKASLEFVKDYTENLKGEVSSLHGNASNVQKQCSEPRTPSILNQSEIDEGENLCFDGIAREGLRARKTVSEKNFFHLSDTTKPPDTSSALILDSKGPSVVTSPNETINRVQSSRSLWSIIADVVRRGFVSLAESQNSITKRSSSNESTSNDAWFPSNVTVDENRGSSREISLRSRWKTTEEEDRKQSSEIIGSYKRPNASINITESEEQHEVTDFPQIVQMEETCISLHDHPLASNVESFKDLHYDKRGQSVPPITAGSSSVSAITSQNTEETTQVGKALMSGGFTEQIETSGPEETNIDLNRRKLLRSKQVLKERFDQWEEAVVLEREQRRIDEMFMREALLEAKKAADMWEVPVGAVLVQHGKIIARGSNLVEELRDSTAHAEILCIREASKLLHSWRLAETTLYVTLEPCSMCAGAILQSRIDTVVWGARNKLLGADGSWVRLFPGGEEESNSSSVSDHARGPIHPFHPKITIRRGILATECSEAMQQFFQRRRKKEKEPEISSSPSCLPISHPPVKFFSKMHDMFSIIMFC